MNIVTKTMWGSRKTVVTDKVAALPRVYIHHTAGVYPLNRNVEEAQMRVLQHIAIDINGHQDIEYNWLVGPSGLIYEARGLKKQSAATLDQNQVSRTICVMGNYMTDTITEPSIQAVIDLIVYLCNNGDLDTTRLVEILGHRDNPEHPRATACPGDKLYVQLPRIRDAVINYKEPKEDDYMLAPRLVRQNGYVNVLLIEGASAMALPEELYNSYVAENPQILRVFYANKEEPFVQNFYAQCRSAGLDPSKLTTGGPSDHF